MNFNIVGIIIGILIFLFGISYFVKEKNDPESRKIYAVTAVIGIIISVVMALKFLFM